MVYFMVGYGGCFFLARALKSEARKSWLSCRASTVLVGIGDVWSSETSDAVCQQGPCSREGRRGGNLQAGKIRQVRDSATRHGRPPSQKRPQRLEQQ